MPEKTSLLRQNKVLNGVILFKLLTLKLPSQSGEDVSIHYKELILHGHAHLTQVTFYMKTVHYLCSSCLSLWHNIYSSHQLGQLLLRRPVFLKLSSSLLFWSTLNCGLRCSTMPPEVVSGTATFRFVFFFCMIKAKLKQKEKLIQEYKKMQGALLAFGRFDRWGRSKLIPLCLLSAE